MKELFKRKRGRSLRSLERKTLGLNPVESSELSLETLWAYDGSISGRKEKRGDRVHIWGRMQGGTSLKSIANRQARHWLGYQVQEVHF